ncbi:MAG: methyl-accepting chemotaxis protein [Deltaproteobacteria bacterium]|nr:methyl-accepting chemotaxis protein [Deltaproteobacteria bacterium]
MKWFADMKVKTKLFVSFGILLSLMTGGGVVGYFGMRTIFQRSEVMYNEHQVASVVASEIKGDVNGVRAAFLSLMAQKEPAAREKEQARIKEITKEIDDSLDTHMVDPHFPEDMKAELKEIKSAWTAFRDTRDNQMIPAFFAGRLDEVKALALGVQAERFKKIISLSDALLDKEMQESRNEIAKSKAAYNRSVMVSVIFGAIGVVIAAFMAFYLSKAIGRPIEAISAVAGKMADGDLENTAVKHDSKDEIGELAGSFGKMAENLRNIIRNIKDGAVRLASASEEFSASSTQIARGSQEQTARASQVATASQEMSATIVEVAKNASTAAEAAREANRAASKGGEVMSRTIDSMNGIAATAKESSMVIAALGNRSQEIGRIIKVIDDIADQTNLLALNAAIEAARAGEQGRGFAVVADEVRKLAERTTTATKEIGGMIKEIQDETGRAVATMEGEVKAVESGVRLAQDAGGALNEIMGQVEKVTSMIQQIATASEEQSTAADQISGDIETVANITKETATGAAQMSQASQEIAHLASSLRATVAMFRISDGHGGHAAGHAKEAEAQPSLTTTEKPEVRLAVMN